MLYAECGCEHDVKNTINTTWQQWKNLKSVLCDVEKMPIYTRLC